MNHTLFVELQREVQALVNAAERQEDLEPSIACIQNCCRRLREEYPGREMKFTRFSLTLITDALAFTPVSSVTPLMIGALVTASQAFLEGFPDQEGYGMVRDLLNEAGFTLIPEPPQDAA
jgi:hypothetical protein